MIFFDGEDIDSKLTKHYFRQLKALLIAVFMIVALVPLVSFSYRGISEGKQMIEEKAATYLMNLSGRNAESIRQFMMERVNDINLLCSILNTSDPEFGQHIRQIKDDPHRPYIDFFILDQSGDLLFSAEDETGDKIRNEVGDRIGNKIIDPAIMKRATISYADNPYNTGNSGDPDLVEWKGVRIKKISLISRRNQSIPVVMLSKKLDSKSDKGAEYLHALVDFRFVDDLLRENNIEDTGEVYLVNRQGWFLSSSRLGAKTLQTRISDHEIKDGGSSVHQAVDYRGKAVLQAMEEISPFGWIVVADQDMVEILDRIRGLEKKAFIYALITGGVVFILAFFISTAITDMVKAKYQREKEMEFQVIQKEKLASLGLLTSGLAHELNTPLANALLYTQIALEELHDENVNRESISQHLSIIIDEVKQGSSVVKNLLYFSRHTQSDSATVDCNRLLARLMEITIPHCESRKIRVEMELEEGIPDVKADASTLQSILTNLVANAIEAMKDGGTLCIRSRYVPVLKVVKIEVNDSGCGIEKENISRIFNPFYSTRKPGEGTGLGLFVSYEMARKLGGDLKVVSSTKEDSKNPGTSFTLELPAEEPEVV